MAHLHLVSGHLHWSYCPPPLSHGWREVRLEGRRIVVPGAGRWEFVPILPLGVPQVGKHRSSWDLLCNG